MKKKTIMAIPLMKFFGFLIRFTSRPISRGLTLLLKRRRLAASFFQYLGNRAQRFEAYMEYKSAHPDDVYRSDLLKVTELSEDQAFHKGVDYFVEVFIFYGVLGCLGIYELRKGILGGHQQAEHIKDIEWTAKLAVQQAGELREELKMAKIEVAEARREIADLRKISSIAK